MHDVIYVQAFALAHRRQQKADATTVQSALEATVSCPRARTRLYVIFSPFFFLNKTNLFFLSCILCPVADEMKGKMSYSPFGRVPQLPFRIYLSVG